jgi:hypothetical protein
MGGVELGKGESFLSNTSIIDRSAGFWGSARVDERPEPKPSRGGQRHYHLFWEFFWEFQRKNHLFWDFHKKISELRCILKIQEMVKATCRQYR